MSRPSPQHDHKARPAWLLRRADQASVAVLVLAALASIGGWWFAQGGWQGRLVELDRMEPREVKYLVDVNQAEWAELAQIPGIGETLAKRIVASRQADGPFLDHADLRRVHGIGPKTTERIAPYLRPIPGGGSLAGR